MGEEIEVEEVDPPQAPRSAASSREHTGHERVGEIGEGELELEAPSADRHSTTDFVECQMDAGIVEAVERAFQPLGVDEACDILQLGSRMAE